MTYGATGHQGTYVILARLLDFTYWIGIAKDAGQYCANCIICQMVKAPVRLPAPLQPFVTSRSWKLAAVDILKVPRSSSICLSTRLFLQVALCNRTTWSKGSVIWTESSPAPVTLTTHLRISWSKWSQLSISTETHRDVGNGTGQCNQICREDRAK